MESYCVLAYLSIGILWFVFVLCYYLKYGGNIPAHGMMFATIFYWPVTIPASMIALWRGKHNYFNLLSTNRKDE